MWVFSPHKDTIPVEWGRRIYKIRAGINEIPVDLAQALFLYQLPQYVENDKEVFELAVKHALARLNNTELKGEKRHGKLTVEDLDNFVVTETREELETLLEEGKKEKELVKK